MKSYERCSVFLTPAETDYGWTERQIRELSGRWGGEPFQPHVTVRSGRCPDASRLAAHLATEAEGLAPLRLVVDRVETGEEFFRTLYLRLRLDPLLLGLHDRLAPFVIREEERDFMPHLSLLYGELSPAAKLDIVDEVQVERESLLFDRLRLVVPDGEEGWRNTDRWTVVEEFTLHGFAVTAPPEGGS